MDKNKMISNEKYMPVLKGKEGEFTALNKLSDEVKDSIVPLIDIVPNNNKTLDTHINSILSYFKKWNKERLLYIDGHMIDDSGLLPDNTHPIKHLIDNLISNGFNIVPVLCDVISIEHKFVVKELAKVIGKGIGLRIFDKSIEVINSKIDEHISLLDESPPKIDLIVDLRSLIDVNIEEKINYVFTLFENLRYLNSWRSVVLCGGNFPVDLTELEPEQVHPIRRKNWLIWKALVQSGQLERNPTYGDYAISHPSPSEFEGEFPNASASIRYTHEENYYVYRGRGTRQHGFEQFFDISETLIYNSHYYSLDHCAGDKFIYTCGTVKAKPGNLTTWRWVGTVHHITVVVNQLRQFFRDLRV